MRKVEVVQHNPEWKNLFEIESQAVTKALGQNAIAVHHIGSTSIPNIYAKPIIDLLVEVKNIYEVSQSNSHMEKIGYQNMGEFGIAGRCYFRKDNYLGERTHHVHVFQVNSSEITRHLAFRDYMIAHPAKALQYSDLKRKLAHQFPNDIESYMDGKDDFIKEIDRLAAR